MNPNKLRQAIVEGIGSKLGKGVINPKQTKQYLSIYANGKLLVLLYECKAHVRVSKLKESAKGNQTCEKIMIVKSEIDIPIALEEIKKLYWEKKLA
jgi:hypothetical protein